MPDSNCQDVKAGSGERYVSSGHVKVAIVVALVVFAGLGSIVNQVLAEDREMAERLFPGDRVPAKLAQVVTPPADKIVPPPGENSLFPARSDGQPYVLNVDRTVNLTDALNRFYFDPRCRAEVWTPFDQIDTIERAQRMLALWPEYNETNVFHKLNSVSIWFERYSGYGP